MFLHFILATLFIALAILAYSRSIMDHDHGLYVHLMLADILIWIVLYFFARYNRRKGLTQAYELEKIFREWIKDATTIV